jgi:hypothetical protein
VTGVEQARDCLTLTLTDPRPGGRSKTFPVPADMRFVSTAPGGYDTWSATLTWPDPSAPPADVITAEAVVHVTDRRNGETVWYGYLDDPGEVTFTGATAWRVTATGPRVILEREVKAYGLRDQELGNWAWDQRYKASPPTTGDGEGFLAHGSDFPTDPPTGHWELQQADGTTVRVGAAQGVRYRPIVTTADKADPLMRAVYLFVSWQASVASGGVSRFQVRVLNQTGSSDVTVYDAAWATGQTDVTAQAGSGGWSFDAKQMVLQWAYTGGTDVPRNSDFWVRAANIAVVMQMVDETGAALTAAQSEAGSSSPWQIMRDMVGRFLAGKVEPDGFAASPADAVEQAAWWGGVTAREVADFVQAANADAWWAVWEPGPSGLPRFEYRSWTATQGTYRYQFGPQHGTTTLDGGTGELANRALVVYDRADGVPASLIMTTTVAELDALGVTRWTVVDLSGRGPLSAGSATIQAQSELAKVNADRTSGQVVVRAPVLDQWEGRVVQPWELRPGGVVKTQAPRSQPLVPVNYTAANGAGQWRATSVTFDVASNSATVALDGGPRTVARWKGKPSKPSTGGRGVPQPPGGKIRGRPIR